MKNGIKHIKSPTLPFKGCIRQTAPYVGVKGEIWLIKPRIAGLLTEFLQEEGGCPYALASRLESWTAEKQSLFLLNVATYFYVVVPVQAQRVALGFFIRVIL